MKTTKKTQVIIDSLNAAKALSREAEIAQYGKTLCHAQVVRSKKTYTRKLKHKKNDYANL